MTLRERALELLRDLYYVVVENRWLNWGSHALIALGLAYLFGPYAAAVFYLLRELEEVAGVVAIVGFTDWRDHAGDVLAAWVGAAIGGLLFG